MQTLKKNSISFLSPLKHKMVYKSRLPDKDYPKDKSVYEYLFHNDRDIPKDTLIYIDIENHEKRYTYEQVHTQILKATSGLQREFDIQKGDVVGICSLNHIDYPIVLHGAVCAGKHCKNLVSIFSWLFFSKVA
jgi:acyl-CoA synthetase (AMP-forming)/AMP-acid ligase II